jgi:hypothetical protein
VELGENESLSFLISVGDRRKVLLASGFDVSHSVVAKEYLSRLKGNDGEI